MEKESGWSANLHTSYDWAKLVGSSKPRRCPSAPYGVVWQRYWSTKKLGNVCGLHSYI